MIRPQPRLFVDEERWQHLRRLIRDDDIARSLFQQIRLRADAILESPMITYAKEGVRLLGPCRELQARVMHLAVMFRLTDHECYLDRARAEMLVAAELRDWNPGHYLDVAEMTFGLALGYDWLRARLAHREIGLIKDAIFEKGVMLSCSGNGKFDWWVKHTNNWNQVCHAGMVAGALAIADDEPELMQRVVERAAKNLHFAADAYSPDGAYPEGAGYWAYGTTFHVLLIDALRSALGDDHGLAGFPGFLESADYIRQMNTPTGDVFNYSDCRNRAGSEAAYGGRKLQLTGEYVGFNTALFWFALEMQRYDLIDAELQQIRSARGDRIVAADRFLPMSLIWWSGMADRKPVRQNAPPLNWMGRGVTPVATHRSAWNDPLARFIGFKGGSPSASHAHMDIGSFVLEAEGVRWAMDTGMHEYHSLESQGVNLWNDAQDGERWTVFRIGPEAHNILRFNNAPQTVTASSELIAFQPDGAFPHTVFDLTSLYAGQAEAVRRGVALPAAGGFLIRDEWLSSARPTLVTWQWLTYAKVEVAADGLRLQQQEKSLRIVLETSSPWTAIVENVSEASGSFGTPNAGLRRILIRVESTAKSIGFISAAVSSDERFPAHIPLDAWKQAVESGAVDHVASVVPGSHSAHGS